MLHVPAVGQARQFVSTGCMLVGTGHIHQLIACLQATGFQHETEDGFERQRGEKTDLEVCAVFGGHQR